LRYLFLESSKFRINYSLILIDYKWCICSDVHNLSTFIMVNISKAIYFMWKK
jgi:hypothetical protein